MNKPGEAKHDESWVDEAAGPLVRPYTMTGGRTRPSSDGFDLVAYILTVEQAQADPALHPEHLAVLTTCRRPMSVAELASQLDIPLGVVRVLLGDLLELELIMVREPADEMQLPDERILEAVMHGLRAL
ncbi:MAG: DUF742 domain-containing protein [Micromonosporaceae bacterium]